MSKTNKVAPIAPKEKKVVLYAHVKKGNKKYLEGRAEENGQTLSEFTDQVIEKARELKL